MRFHIVMLLIVILVSLSMHGMASAATASNPRASAMQASPLAWQAVRGDCEAPRLALRRVRRA
jgi:hypothetical protein